MYEVIEEAKHDDPTVVPVTKAYILGSGYYEGVGCWKPQSDVGGSSSPVVYC
jgi:hypothetical protein